MKIGAEIRAPETRCAERERLSHLLRSAIARVYECRARWETAVVRKQDVPAAFTALSGARAQQIEAQRQYQIHLDEHGCATTIGMSARAKTP